MNGKVAFAQKFRKGAAGSFGSSQWYLGLQMGVNFTTVNALLPYSEFSYAEPEDAQLTEKQYQSAFKKSGKQLGIKVAVSPVKSLNISLTGLYSNTIYSYTNAFQWQDEENPDNALQLNFEHSHQLDYLEFPLVVRYIFFA